MRLLRNILGVLILTAMSIEVYGQSHGVQVGVRAGGNLLTGSNEVQSLIGGQAGVDVSYSIRWTVGSDMGMGPKIGVGFSRTGGGVKKDDIYETFTNTDYLGHPMDYTVTAQAEQRFQHLQIEVPLMLSLQLKRFIINIGGKFLYTVSGTTNQTINKWDITALYREYNVPVHNEAVTGVLRDDQLRYAGQSALPKMRVLIGAELGYEWEVGDYSYVGLSAYFDYGVWAGEGVSSSGPFISVSPIVNPSAPIAQVQVGLLQPIYSPKVGYMDFGVKIYYQFESQDRSYYGLHKPLRRPYQSRRR